MGLRVSRSHGMVILRCMVFGIVGLQYRIAWQHRKGGRDLYQRRDIQEIPGLLGALFIWAPHQYWAPHSILSLLES